MIEFVSTEHGVMVFVDNKQTPFIIKDNGVYYGEKLIAPIK